MVLGSLVKFRFAFWAAYLQLSLAPGQAEGLLAAGAFQIDVGLPVPEAVVQFLKKSPDFAVERPEYLDKFRVLRHAPVNPPGKVPQDEDEEQFENDPAVTAPLVIYQFK